MNCFGIDTMLAGAGPFGYEILEGNALWRFGFVLLVMLAAMAAGRIVQFALNSYAKRADAKEGDAAVSALILKVHLRFSR